MAKTKTKTKARKIAAQVETNPADVARKIWLAGIGVYGTAYKTAVKRTSKVNEESIEMFEKLVDVGSEIEHDIVEQINKNETVTKTTDRVKSAFDSARSMQEKAREQFEDRMERMRNVLGIRPLGTPGERIARRLDSLEAELLDITRGLKARGDVMLKKRLAGLADDIEKFVGDTDEVIEAPVKKKKKKATKAKVKSPELFETEELEAQDLTVISGLGPAFQKRLVAEGISRFEHLANLTKAEIAVLDEKLNANGRIERDEWVKQAKAFLKG